MVAREDDVGRTVALSLRKLMNFLNAPLHNMPTLQRKNGLTLCFK
jgi:hypothetical protein